MSIMENKNSAARAPRENLQRERLLSTPPVLDGAFWEDALGFALKKIEENRLPFASSYPAPASEGNVYPALANVEWTSSFWTGLLFLAHEASGKRGFADTALAQLADYRRRLDERIETETHDLGFLYSLSCVAAYKLFGDRAARATALKAADLLMLRFHPKAGVIQAWGNLGDPAQRGRIIIDCAMNLPLLHWASEETGNPHYREAAASHLKRANEYLIRPDWSSFHTYYFDADAGTPLKGSTAQGYADDSCWARGQAWGVLGNALCCRYIRDPAYLEASKGLANYFLNRLPEDLVCYWDLCFVDGPEERDSSGAAIAACGLLELAAQLPPADADRRRYEYAALRILESLARNYTSAGAASSNGILLHAVYGKPNGKGIDECCIWGDYFYVEGLLRASRGWKPYW